jgi:hypothetical protein
MVCRRRRCSRRFLICQNMGEGGVRPPASAIPVSDGMYRIYTGYIQGRLRRQPCSLDSPEKCWENTSDAALFCKYIQRVLTCSSVHKSVNLQYDTLVRWANGTNDLLTKRLMFQVLFFFHKTLQNSPQKPFQFIFLQNYKNKEFLVP